MATTSTARAYFVGRPGIPWSAAERAEWRDSLTAKRSYAEEVVTKIDRLKEKFDVVQYGALPYDAERYPLYAVKTRGWDPSRPSVLVTGGVHGYETSGVQGALLFLETAAEAYSSSFNILVAPCISPWGYEHIQRWNAHAVDPNRSFHSDRDAVRQGFDAAEDPAEESAALLRLVDSLKVDTWTAHVDLHETTDTDESEFRPAKAARDGVEYEADTIPDGFYLVGDSEKPQAAWHTAMIDAVRRVTHIAPPDGAGKIIGEPIVQEGCIVYPTKSLHLCSSTTGAEYATTTEVYPDSPSADDETCNRAQEGAEPRRRGRPATLSGCGVRRASRAQRLTSASLSRRSPPPPLQVAAVTSALDFILAEREACK